MESASTPDLAATRTEGRPIHQRTVSQGEDTTRCTTYARIAVIAMNAVLGVARAHSCPHYTCEMSLTHLDCDVWRNIRTDGAS